MVKKKQKAKADKKPAKARGKPTYEKEVEPYLDRIKSWRHDGAKIDWIAEQFPIARSTFYKWAEKHTDLADVLKIEHTAFYDKIVLTAENTLLDKLVDRELVVEKATEQWIDADGKKKKHTIMKKKLVLADTTAVIFALKNRKPERWNNDEHNLSKARYEKLKAEIETITKGEDIGTLIMQSLNKYIGGDEDE